MKNIKKENYERIEITFSKLNETEIEVYNFILEQSKMLGKGKYIKNILYEHMKAAEK